MFHQMDSLSGEGAGRGECGGQKCRARGGDGTDPGFADASRTVAVAERYGDTVVGVKVREAPDIVGDQIGRAMREAREQGG